MRNLKVAKLVTVILAAVLLIGAFAAVTSFAEDTATVTEAPASIISKNLNYAARIEILYAVKADEVGEGDSVMMLFWEDEQPADGYTYETALYRKNYYSRDTINGFEGCYLFASRGVVPAKVNDSIYSRPVIRNVQTVDGKAVTTYTYGDVVEYNIGMYAADKLSELENTEAQKKLYLSLVEYANAAGAKFGAGVPNYFLAKVDSPVASLGSYGAKYSTADADGKILLRADAVDADGNYFVKWVDKNGADVSTSRVASVVAPTTGGLCTYTPVYGAASESAYAYGYDFNDLATGDINIGSPNLSKAPTHECYGSGAGTNLRRWAVEYSGISGIKFTTAAVPATTAYDEVTKTYTLEQTADGSYVVGSIDRFEVVEEASGNKELVAHREQRQAGYTVAFTSKADDVTEIAYTEVDYTFDDLTTSDVSLHINVTLKGQTLAGDQTISDSYRTNLSSDPTAKTTFLYPEGNRNLRIRDEDGNVKNFSNKGGETVTFGVRFVVKDETDAEDNAVKAGYLQYYINGEYHGEFACSVFKNYDANMNFDSAYISALSVNVVTAARDDISFDNIVFAK